MTFISIEDFGNDLRVPDISLKHIEKTDFINTQSFATLINEQCRATMQSVLESGVDADTITLDKISEKNVGAIIIYYELLTSLVGAMFGVNTYNQPGVELGKTILYKNLGNNQ
jgi:glucose-6-phosphate isomerase